MLCGVVTCELWISVVMDSHAISGWLPREEITVLLRHLPGKPRESLFQQRLHAVEIVGHRPQRNPGTAGDFTVRDGMDTVLSNGVQRRLQDLLPAMRVVCGLLIHASSDLCTNVHKLASVVAIVVLLVLISMTLTSSRKALRLRMWALFMFFFIPGLLMASWATRTPAIRDILSVSTAEMGIVLFGLSIGSMSGILCSAWLVKRFGTRAVIRTTMCCAILGMLVLSVALWYASPVMFAPGLLIFGGSFGAAEVAINVEGAAVEREMNKTVLPMMHGFYSLGTLAGAGVGMALTASGVSANLHILLAALISVVPVLTGIRAIPDGTGKTPLMNTKRRKRAAVLP